MCHSLVRFLLSGLFLTLLIAAPRAKAASPCCPIVGIQGNVVTARDNATGKTFTIRVNDRAQLARLRVGQWLTAEQRALWSRPTR